jgi:hypothetical protein
MKFEEIKQLLVENQKDQDWGHSKLGDVLIAYCLKDVNLRIELSAIAKEGLPYFLLSFFYMATLLDSIPLMKRDQGDTELSPSVFIPKAIEAFKKYS